MYQQHHNTQGNCVCIVNSVEVIDQIMFHNVSRGARQLSGRMPGLPIERAWVRIPFVTVLKLGNFFFSTTPQFIQLYIDSGGNVSE